MNTIRYSLFTKFENALRDFHHTLEESRNRYAQIFNELVAGKDMEKEVIDDTTFFLIQEKRLALQEEQRRISRVIMNDQNAYCTLSEIDTKIHDKFEYDIVSYGKKCIDLYGEIMRYTSSIEKYYSAKAHEYKSFFDSLYDVDKSKKEDYQMSANGNVKHTRNDENKQGVLIRARV